jgi:hypothetical protein
MLVRGGADYQVGFDTMQADLGFASLEPHLVRRGKRCRMHGGNSPGAPRGEKNGNYRHGRYTKEMLAERQHFAELLRESRDLISRMR